MKFKQKSKLFIKYPHEAHMFFLWLHLDEFNPEEFGVCHPTLKAFIPLEDLGSRMEAGKPAREDSCVQGM
jgi:hypothetical protein